MNKTRISGVIAGAVLVVAVVLVALGINAAPEAHGAVTAAVGFGDLRRYEGQSFDLNIGMGDLQKFESQAPFSASGIPSINPLYIKGGEYPNASVTAKKGLQIGMGDLHLFEAVQSGQAAGK